MISRRRRNTKPNGFSRIETLLVIGITGGAAVILLPALAQSNDAARERESKLGADCRSNLRKISLAIIQYTQDNDEKFPLAATRGEGFGWALEIKPFTLLSMGTLNGSARRALPKTRLLA